ncbi:MAG: hypothetical protein NUK65_03565 [Firmicutes bacterium]|nr:hypothetical protein [Bacillota bacterium]
MFWGIVVNEHRKVFKRSLFWVALIILTGISLIMFAGLYFSQQAGETLISGDIAAITWPFSLVAALQHADQLGIFIVVLLTATVACQDYSLGTMRLWLSRGLKRPTLWTAKTTALILPFLLIAALPILASSPVTAYFTLMLKGTINYSEINLIQVLLGVLRTAYSFLPYASITLFLAVATRSLAATFGGGAAFALLENLVCQLLGEKIEILKFLPRQMANSLANSNWLISNTSAIAENSALLANGYAVVGLLLWALLFFSLTLLISRGQDLTE